MKRRKSDQWEEKAKMSVLIALVAFNCYLLAKFHMVLADMERAVDALNNLRGFGI